ncbi:MAG: hypothetical protein KGL53_15250, partial [Elusimicrobia bacterium]|nr:hypothetical protein [Elusimicrobiota bacterium]
MAPALLIALALAAPARGGERAVSAQAALGRAVMYGDAAGLEAARAGGADLGAPGLFGMTPLELAAFF